MTCSACGTELTEMDGMHYCMNDSCKRAFLPVELLGFGTMSLFSPKLSPADTAALARIKRSVIGYPTNPAEKPKEVAAEEVHPVMPVPVYEPLSAPDAWRARLKGVCHYLAETKAPEEQMVETLSKFLSDAYGEDVQ